MGDAEDKVRAHTITEIHTHTHIHTHIPTSRTYFPFAVLHKPQGEGDASREDTNMGNGADDDVTEDSSARTLLQGKTPAKGTRKRKRSLALDGDCSSSDEEDLGLDAVVRRTKEKDAEVLTAVPVASKSMATLVPAGSHLIIAINRATVGGKITTNIKYAPLRQSVFTGSSTKMACLVAIARHHGDAVGNGHFTMDGLTDKQWWHVDDSRVSSIASPHVGGVVLVVYKLHK